MTDNRVTYNEIVELFGGEIPMEAVSFLLTAPDEMTVEEFRSEIHRMAKEHNAARSKAVLDNKEIDTLVRSLEEEIIADAFADRKILDGRLADRLIRERGNAHDAITALRTKVTGLDNRIENAAQAMAETQPSWERRCHAIVAALGMDFGGPLPDVPEQSGWYARKLAAIEAERDRQYDENVNRIAAEGQAILERDEALAEVERLREKVNAFTAVCYTAWTTGEAAELPGGEGLSVVPAASRYATPQPKPRDEIAEAARAGIIEAVLAADDVWVDYGNGWRLHMSFLPRSADLAHHFMALRALAGKDG